MSWKENSIALGKIQKGTKLSLFQQKVTEIYKDGNEIVVTVSYKIKFINNARFIATSLSSITEG